MFECLSDEDDEEEDDEETITILTRQMRLQIYSGNLVIPVMIRVIVKKDTVV